MQKVSLQGCSTKLAFAPAAGLKSSNVVINIVSSFAILHICCDRGMCSLAIFMVSCFPVHISSTTTIWVMAYMKAFVWVKSWNFRTTNMFRWFKMWKCSSHFLSLFCFSTLFRHMQTTSCGEIENLPFHHHFRSTFTPRCNVECIFHG